MIFAIIIITAGYIVMGHHRTPQIVENDVTNIESFDNEINIAKKMYNLDFLNSIKPDESGIDKLNKIILSENFLQEKLLSELELPSHAKVILETRYRKENPEKAKYRYSNKDYIALYKLLNSREMKVVNRYVLEQIVPNSVSKYINQTGENTISVILIIIGYVILIPLAILYRKQK